MTKAKAILISMRPKQWIKNLLVFLPLFFGKSISNHDLLINTFQAFCIYNLAMGAIYLLNDISDLAQDKKHPVKKKRPIAAGHLSLPEAWTACLVVFGGALAWAYEINPLFCVLIAGVGMLNVIYSKYFKHFVILDIILFSFFYILRMEAGALVTDIKLSHWLIVCAGSLAVFIGISKRRGELHFYQHRAKDQRKVLANYSIPYLDNLLQIAATASIIFYSLYSFSDQALMYSNSRLFYTIPFAVYGIFRYLYLVQEKKWGEDPIRVLFKDKNSFINLSLWIICCGLMLYKA